MNEARRFLTLLFGEDLPENLHLLIWTLPDRRSRWHQSIEDAVSDAEKLRHEHNVYFGVGLSPKNFGNDKRCSSELIAGIGGLWADIDFQSPVHRKPNLPPNEEAARELLNTVGVPPSIVVHSGNGLQAYWLFREFLLFEDAAERFEAAKLSARWNNTLKARAKERGWDVDSTFDLSRILRLPGTFNRKELDPKPVRLLEVYDDRRYNIHEFDEFTRDDEEATSVLMPSQGSGAVPSSVGPLNLDANASPPFDKWEALVELDPKVRRTWNRQRTDFQDQSASAYDMSLATYAVQAGWSDQEVVNLLIAHRRRHGDDLKLRQDYYARTIAKARESLHRERETTVAMTMLEEAVEKLTTATQGGEKPSQEEVDEARREILRFVSSLLTVEVTRFVKYTSDPPAYRLETTDGAIMLGGASTLTSQARFKTAVYAATGRAIPKFKSDRWDQIIESLAKAAVEEGIGEEATEKGTARSWLTAYIAERIPLEDRNEAALLNYPFMEGGELFIFGSDLRRWLQVAQGERISSLAMGTILRAYGCEPKTIAVTVEGKSTTRSVWRVNTGALW